jgi:type IV secretory pathway ATPase VirB11/archaellum biosynthesis ATPase
LVKNIECSGPDEKIIVSGAMGRKPTSITLSKEQIDEIIERFSQATRIPVSEGIYKVVHGNLILSAIVSEIIGSKFIIKKMR